MYDMIENTDKKKSIKLELPKNPELLGKWCLFILDFLEKIGVVLKPAM